MPLLLALEGGCAIIIMYAFNMLNKRREIYYVFEKV